jgi:guanosine-3',5'-bis(diphosphate) 3'-pyrophosphohydrolase
MNLVDSARDFATRAHGSTGELRKYTNDPYIVHPAEVAQFVESVPHTPEMVAGAWLHDVREKVPGVTAQMLRDQFGHTVAGHVEELTDITTLADGSRRERKRRECARLETISAQSKTIKLGDILSNVRSIVRHDPKFARVYVPEKAAQLQALVDGDPTLLGLVYRELVAACRHLNIALYGKEV